MKNIDIETFREDCASMDVYVKDKKVATLIKENKQYILTYLPETKDEDFISLLMPVRRAPWIETGMPHPFFLMNLPEGALGEILKIRFGKKVCSEQMSLLGLVGSNSIGAVRVVPNGYPLDWQPTPEVYISSLMNNSSNTGEVFHGMMLMLAGQGISGAMPKVLADKNGITRYTVRGEGFIFKHDEYTDALSCNYSGISLNEYLSLKAAARAGLEVSECSISKDGHTMATRRFDGSVVTKDGDEVTRKFEDFCSLLGLSSADKYKGSMERIAKVIGMISSKPTADKKTLVRAHILNMIIGNGDAHLKNFGILYTKKEDVRLSPTYDVVTVRAFDEFYKDIPALLLGDKKEWGLGEDFKKFAMFDCGLPMTLITKIVMEVIKGVQDTIPDIANAAHEHEWFADHAKRMILVWHRGLSMTMGVDMENVNEILAKYNLSPIVFPELVPEPVPA